MTTMTSKPSTKDRGIVEGYRSGLEEKVAGFLRESRIPFEYEPLKVPFIQPAKPRKYTPDFILPNGIIIETKGRWVTSDRLKFLMLRDSQPHLDIRFVFSNPRSKIGKKSKTTYAMWCDRNNFLWHGYSDKEPIPESWLEEPPRELRIT